MEEQHGALHEVSQHPAAFSAAFVVFFFVTLAFLGVMGATPNPTVASASDLPQSTNTTVAPTQPESPVRVVATSINLDATVSNPTTTDINTLDNDLLSGAVRYPASALLGQGGTVLLFGHSSYLPIVKNQAYKTFDGIQNLKPGSMVSVYSATTEYRYSVTSVRVANANEDTVDLSTTGRNLTLVTCDSFADKTNRFVVEASFVGAYALAQ